MKIFDDVKKNLAGRKAVPVALILLLLLLLAPLALIVACWMIWIALWWFY